MQRHADLMARQRNFVTEFMASGTDPRSLRKMTIPASGGSGDQSLKTTADRANLIAIGTVESVQYRSEELSPISEANVRLREVLKGASDSPLIVVTQIGGPVLSTAGPVLMQTSRDEVLLPGDEVLLMLVRSSDGRNSALGGVGIVFFSNGLARPEASSPLASQIEGKRQTDVIVQVKSAITR